MTPRHAKSAGHYGSLAVTLDLPIRSFSPPGVACIAYPLAGRVQRGRLLDKALWGEEG